MGSESSAAPRRESRDRLNEPSAKQAIGSAFAANAIIAIINLATGMMAARILGPSGRGAVAAIQTLPALLGTAVLLGIPVGVAYYSARNPSRSRQIVYTGIVLCAVLSLFGVLAGHLLVPWALAGQEQETRSAAQNYLWLISLQAVQMPLFMALWSMQRVRIWNLLRLLPSVCWLVVLICLGLMRRATASSLTVGYLLLYALITPVALLAFARESTGRWGLRLAIARRTLRYGLPAGLSSLPANLNLRLDQALMAALLPASTLGLYAVAVSWSGAMVPITSALTATIFPRIATRRGSAATEELGRNVRRSSLLAMVMVVGLGVATPPALTVLFGHAFASAWPAALVLVVASGVSAVASTLEESLRALGDTHKPLVAQVVGLPVTVGLLVLWLKPFGLMGAAMASLASYLTSTVVLAVGCRRRGGLTVRDLLVPTAEDIRQVSNAAQDVARTIGRRFGRVRW